MAAPKCLGCEEDVPADGGASPFCSPRCKAEDLCNWLDGTYTGGEEELEL